jgi:tetratricopeptide (TPR) repeat protein
VADAKAHARTHWTLTEELRMSTQTVTCPHCQTLLRSDRPLRAGISLRCPDCKSPFTAPESDPSTEFSTPVTRPSLIGAPFIIAVTVSLLLGGALITAAAILSGSRTPPKPEPVTQTTDQTEDRQRLEEERKQLAEAREQVERDARKIKYERAMARADRALAKGLHAEAEKAYQEALDLMPGDKDAIKGVVDAQVAAKNASETERKNLAEVNRLLEDSKKAVADKQFAAAVQLLNAAQKLAPTNRAVIEALLAAQKGLDEENAEKKKLADFKKLMEAGKASLAAERYADALKEFTSALQLMPDDLEAIQGRNQAKDKLGALGDKEKQQKAVNDLLDRARKSKDAKRFKDSKASLEAVLRIDKNNQEALLMMKDVDLALKKARTENTKLLVQADLAVRMGRVQDAKKLVDQAMNNWPEDEKAEKMQNQLASLANLGDAVVLGYQKYMLAGTLAMNSKNYTAAVTAFTAALQLVPNDPVALVCLAQAQQALQTLVAGQAAYNQAMNTGKAALARNAWNTAIQAFNSALKLVPGDPPARNGLSQARYGRAMATGNQALGAKQKANAITAFTAALAQKPGDPAALNGLKQARMLR